MTDIRSANPDELDALADLLRTPGDGGAYGELTDILNRARELSASSELAGLVPLLSWLADTADQLRDKAALLRGDTPTPDWGSGPPTAEDLERFQNQANADPSSPFETVGQANLDRILKLAQQEELSEAEMEEMRSLLGAFSSDPQFAAALVDDLGMAEFLALSRRVEASGDSEEARELREELARVLTASFWLPGDIRPGTEEYEQWTENTPQGQAFAERLAAFQLASEEDLAEAAELVEGLIGNASDLSQQELFMLNEFLSSNSQASGGDFNRALMDAIGVEGLVTLAERLPELAYGGGDPALSEGYADLQTNIANALASATTVPHPSDPWYHHWAVTSQAQWYEEFMAEFDEVGRSEFVVSFSAETDPRGIENVRGYQMLLNLMEEGSGYSAGFLTDVAENIREAEGDGTYFWPLGPVDATEIEYGTADQRFARDPMNSVLGIMGQHPDAATAYLSDPANLDYLIERDWLPAFGSTHHDPQWDYSGFGDALEAATTGRRAGSNDEYARTPEGEALMREVVERFSADNGALIADDGPFTDIRPQLGRMSAAYIAEMQYAVSRRGLMFQGDDAPALLRDLPVDYFLAQVGRDPDAYAAITGANQAYTALAIDMAVNGVTAEEPPMANRVNDAVGPGATIAGIMSSARAASIRDGVVESDEEFNSRLGVAEDIAGLVLDEATGKIPVVGGIVGWGAGELSESLFNTLERDNSQQAYEEGDRMWQSGRDAYSDFVLDALERAVGDREDVSATSLYNGAVGEIDDKYDQELHWDGE
ncbi:DUF6571 family protein [Streptomyces sp. 7-21]|uniref:DUF6571 family protein n=1 Tax=Streptomyces sp. 7-21 TaxID=2802283 RepID=UPI00191F07CD|nr:DUF6571 family protein [Streptomyces sp. 7-21]MBL1068287.1 hypothetical protein [Streptomyces sp. 7-21]